MREPIPDMFLDAAFERIEGSILPCLTMLLETLIDAVAKTGASDPKILAADLWTLADELEGLTQSVGRSNRANDQAESIRVAVG
ncbi:MAG: hypothetical protein ABIO85_09715 [Sphingomicrobium sp.]